MSRGASHTSFSLTAEHRQFAIANRKTSVMRSTDRAGNEQKIQREKASHHERLLKLCFSLVKAPVSAVKQNICADHRYI